MSARYKQSRLVYQIHKWARLMLSLLAIFPFCKADSPSTVIDWPIANRQVQGDMFILGSATADQTDGGVDIVQLVVRQDSTGLYWNGNDWQSDWIRYPVQVENRGSPDTEWRERLPASRLKSGTYYSRAWTRSVAGNGDPNGNAEVSYSWDSRPQQVHDLAVTEVTENTIKVTWRPDRDDRVISFRLLVDGQQVSTLSNPSSQEYVFSNLNPGTSYDLQVIAVGDDDTYVFDGQHTSEVASVSAATEAATTLPPTRQPTRQPTRAPTRQPTNPPTQRTTDQPTRSPTNPPTPRPVVVTPLPTQRPTPQPVALTSPPEPATPAPITTNGSPSTIISNPSENSTVQGDLRVIGVALSPSSIVQSVEVVIKNVDSNLHWNGNDWQADWIRFPVPPETMGVSSSSWRAVIPASRMIVGRYTTRAWTRDVDGNGDPNGNAMADFTWTDRPPSVIGLMATDVTSTSIRIQWQSVPDDRVRSFDVYLDDEDLIWIPNPSATSFIFGDLLPGTSYSLGVTALGDENNFSFSSLSYSERIDVQATTLTEDGNVPPTEAPTRSPTKQPTDEEVVWEENFDRLDLTRWIVEHSTYGDGGNQLQCYRPENVSVRDGKLILRAVHETYTCPNGSTRRVTSGMVRSIGLYLAPGQVLEFRMKLTPADEDNQEGLWPAIWASGWAGKWPYGGEIDFIEVMTANDPRRSIYSIHYEDTNGNRGITNQPVFGVRNFSEDWHTIHFYYGPGGRLYWFLDGIQVFKVTDAPTAQGWPIPFDQETNEIKINLQLGGNPGPLNDAALGDEGATFEVDYIRAYVPAPDDFDDDGDLVVLHSRIPEGSGSPSSDGGLNQDSSAGSDLLLASFCAPLVCLAIATLFSV